jgi:peptidoglycan/LPS O-acetylase OafA/YrhL
MTADPGAAGGAATTGTGRVGNVDVLRAVAALGVLAGHAYALGGRVLPIKAQHFYDVPLLTTATGVWLFFGISGYVISRPFVGALLTGRPLPRLVPYALRRGFRIFPLYWIALTAVVLIAGEQGTRAWQFPFHYLLLNNLIPGREQALFSVAWTLTLEVLFYIAVPALAIALRRRRPALSAERLAMMVIALWAASIAFTVFGDLQGDDQTGLWLRGSFPAMWQMFCPGILLAISPHLGESSWRRWVVDLPARRAAIAVVAVTLVAGALLNAAAPLRFGVVDYQLLVDASRPLFAIGYGLVIAAAIRARPWGRRSPWMLRLGLVSYGIYLLHAVLLDFLLSGAGHGLIPWPQDTAAAYVVHTAFLAGLTIPLSLASWRLLEQPSIRLGGSLGGGWARTHAEAAPTRRTNAQ